MKKTLFIFLTLISFSLFGQKSNDSLITTTYKKSFKIFNRQRHLRIGLGYQNSFFSEIGISGYKIRGLSKKFTYHNLNYISIDWSPRNIKLHENNIFGIKSGIQIKFDVIEFCAELKYLTDFEKNDLFFTPKIGIGHPFYNIFLFYGYNFSTMGDKFSNIGHHQISLVFTYLKRYKCTPI